MRVHRESLNEFTQHHFSLYFIRVLPVPLVLLALLAPVALL